MKRTKPAKFDTLPDGRILGKKMEDAVPEQYRNIIPKPKKRPSNGPSEAHKRTTQAINALCRTRMPLAMTRDGQIEIDNTRIRLKGLNQAKFNALICGIRSGMTIRDASRLCGIHEQTIQTWKRWGQLGKFPYDLILATLQQAEAELERDLMEAIRQAGTVRLTYEEETKEETTNEHGETTVKVRTAKKVRFPQWNAAAWILERTRPETYRSDREIAGVDEPDILADIEAMKQVSDITVIQEMPEQGDNNGQDA